MQYLFHIYTIIHIEINNLYKPKPTPLINNLVFVSSKYLKVMTVEMHVVIPYMFQRVAMVLLFLMNL